MDNGEGLYGSGPGFQEATGLDGDSYLVQAPTVEAADAMKRTQQELRGQLSAADGLGEAIDSYKPEMVYLMNGNQKVRSEEPPHTPLHCPLQPTLHDCCLG